MGSWYGLLPSMHRLPPMFLMTWTISQFQLTTPLLKWPAVALHNGQVRHIMVRFLACASILFIIPQSFLAKELLRSHGPVAPISVAAVHTNSQATTTTDKAKSSPGAGLQKKGRDIYVDS